MKRLTVHPTKDRKGVQGEYIIQLNPNTVNELEGMKNGSYFLVGKRQEMMDLFCWDSVPGGDNDKLIKFLRNDFDIDWAKNEYITKPNESTILISAGENSAKITMDENKEKATLEISDGRTLGLKVKTENGKQNLYGREIWALAFLQVDEDVPEGGIRIDQTLRTALGAKEGDEVFVKKAKPIKRGISKRILTRTLKTQIELMRVKRAVYLDMEKNISRISKDVMRVIGVDEGDFIEIQSFESTINIRALELSNRIRKLKEEQIEANPERYPNCIEILSLERLRKTEHDLPWIFLDADARKELGVEPCDVVRIYRDVGHTFYKQLTILSVPVVLTMIGAVIAIDGLSLTEIILFLFIGLIAAFSFMLIEKRKQIFS
jgi:formylmethanofuran dehydrogenase subunit D